MYVLFILSFYFIIFIIYNYMLLLVVYLNIFLHKFMYCLYYYRCLLIKMALLLLEML